MSNNKKESKTFSQRTLGARAKELEEGYQS